MEGADKYLASPSEPLTAIDFLFEPGSHGGRTNLIVFNFDFLWQNLKNDQLTICIGRVCNDIESGAG